jgi:hypothetical protein
VLVALGTSSCKNPATQPLQATVALQDLHPAAHTSAVAFAVTLTVLLVVVLVVLATLVAARFLNYLMSRGLFWLISGTSETFSKFLVTKISSLFTVADSSWLADVYESVCLKIDFN